MGKDYFIDCLLNGRPYFGRHLAARQGVANRHSYMQAIVEWFAKNKNKNSINILEIGSWAGMSTITWALAAQNYYKKCQIECVDSWEPYLNMDENTDTVYQKMTQALKSGNIYKLFQHNIKSCGVDKIIHIHNGKSRDVLPILKNNYYDIVFIDGSHSFDDVLFDISEAKRLVTDGGGICGDDLEIQLKDIDADEHREALESKSDYVVAGHMNTGYHPGVTEAVGRQFDEVAVWDGFWAVRKLNDSWNGKIDLNDCHIGLPKHLTDIQEKLSCDDEFERVAATIELIEKQEAYNIMRAGDRFIAVSKALGSIRLYDERVGEREIEPYILIAETIEGIHEKIISKCDEFEVIAASIQLVEEQRAYNIVKAGDRFIAVSKSLGPLNLYDERIGEREIEPHILIADTIEGIHEKIIRKCA